MIYLNGLDSIIESVYLGERLSPKLGLSTIFINPDEIKYLTNKLVILTKEHYSEDYINLLISNRNKIISRVYNKNSQIEVQPYIVRYNDNIMWNGRVLEDNFNNLDEIMIQGYADYDEKEGKLYFPKIRIDSTNIKLMDKFNNLTCLGWALHQVGINLKNNTPFINLDYLKLQKAVL